MSKAIRVGAVFSLFLASLVFGQTAPSASPRLTYKIQMIEQASASIGNLTTRLTAARAQAAAAFRLLLTPDQKAKFSQFQGWRAVSDT